MEGADPEVRRKAAADWTHGRPDLGSPLGTAWELAQAWPDAELHVVDDSGHTGSDAYRDLILRTTDRLAAL
jgi:proline iminopeptidase